MRLRTREMVEPSAARSRRLGLEQWARLTGIAAFDRTSSSHLISTTSSRPLYGPTRRDRRIRGPAIMCGTTRSGRSAWWLTIHRGGTIGWLSEPGDVSDSLDRFRSITASPGARHFAWDTGHIAAAVELRARAGDAVEWYEIATYRPFLEQGRRGPMSRASTSRLQATSTRALSVERLRRSPVYAASQRRSARARSPTSRLGLGLLRSEVARLSTANATRSASTRSHGVLGLLPVRRLARPHDRGSR